MRCFDAIDIEADDGLIDDLVNVNVGGAGNVGHAFGELLGDLVTGFAIAADDLHIDGCGQAEVENLRRDVGGLEEEGHVRKLVV